MTFTVVKRHKRLHVVNERGESVYTPPDFLRVDSRKILEDLADRMNDDTIDAIMAFEANCRRRTK